MDITTTVAIMSFSFLDTAKSVIIQPNISNDKIIQKQLSSYGSLNKKYPFMFLLYAIMEQ